jgi:hypothetical protein
MTQPTDVRELVDLLRDDAVAFKQHIVAGHCIKAAAALESQLSHIERLEEALERFAKLAAGHEWRGDRQEVLMLVNIGNCRKACAALNRSTDNAS